MTGLCLGIAFLAVQAWIPATSVTLSWIHSVEKTRWEEDYRIVGAQLIPASARVQGSGAGMEPPDEATLSGGWWHYQPTLGPLDKLTLARSIHSEDYELCWLGRCRTMAELLGPPPKSAATVDLFPCRDGQAPE